MYRFMVCCSNAKALQAILLGIVRTGGSNFGEGFAKGS